MSTRARAMATALLLLSVVTAVLAAEPAPAPGDWSQIRRVIASQREALVEGDGERAFGFATPALRNHFGSAERFMRMVRESYSALLEARDAAFLEGAVIAGDVVQPLRLVLPDGSVRVALYGMQRQGDGTWRIAACVIAPSTLRTAAIAPRVPT